MASKSLIEETIVTKKRKAVVKAISICASIALGMLRLGLRTGQARDQGGVKVLVPTLGFLRQDERYNLGTLLHMRH